MATATKSRPAKARAKPKKTETVLLVMVLDRSGSMASCVGSTIEGFNTFLHDQRKQRGAGDASMTLVQFDAVSGEPACQISYDAVALREVADLGTPQNPYHPRGMTPLYDAVGESIRRAEQMADRFDHVQFVIQTDGGENSSTEWRQDALYKLVGAKRAEGWDFIFMGANIDPYATSAVFNVSPLRSISYDSVNQSPQAFATMSASVRANRVSRFASMDSAIPELTNAPVSRYDPSTTPTVPPVVSTTPVKTSKAKPIKSSTDDPAWLH